MKRTSATAVSDTDRRCLHWKIVDSPLGEMLVARSGSGLYAVAFGDDPLVLHGELRSDAPFASLVEDDGTLDEAVEALRLLCVGENAGREWLEKLGVEQGGSEFQRSVWQAVCSVAPGETRTYKEIAELAGFPSAARAVGQACGANRLALVIPCHRVVRNDGALGAWRWGSRRKAALLGFEHLNHRAA